MIGTTLAQYRITEKLGEGGMGAVYRATDTKLGRDVALKLLPDRFADDAERLARFHREARTLAALNHPNIAAIHDLESDQGRHFLVMELVDGDDLSERIARGPLPVDEATRIARDIATGLEEAHAQGIIHRDLKPANVKVSDDGKVKVLDFGLARAFEGGSTAEEDIDNSPTLTAMTGAGVILGTAAYMSPEQARGTALDRRTDIWSFGVLLYEMLTGRRLFQGETISDTLAGILKTDPDWDALPDDTPDVVRHLLARCLQRDRLQRLQDMGEARIMLSGDGSGVLPSTLIGASAAVDEVAAGPSRRTVLLGAVAAVVAGVILGGAIVKLTAAPPSAEVARWFEVALPQEETGMVLSSEISPDGAMVAYEMANRIWLRRFDTGATHALPGTEDGSYPFWSPDSRQVAYFEGRRIKRVLVAGGDPVPVGEIPGEGVGAGGTWMDDGRLVVTMGTEAGLLAVPARGGAPTSFLPADTSSVQDFHDPHAIGDDRGLLYVAHMKGGTYSRIFIHRDGDATLVHDAGEDRITRPVWSESGHVVFGAIGTNAGIWAVAWDLVAGRARGEPFLVTSEGSRPSVSDDGTLLCTTGSTQRNWQLVRCDRRGTVVEQHGEAREYFPFFALSPDGGSMAMCVVEDTRSQLWVLDLRRGTQSRLSFDELSYSSQTWAPGGQTIYASAGVTAGGPMQDIFEMSVEGLHPPRKLVRGVMPRVDPAGNTMMFSSFVTGSVVDLMVLDLGGDPEPRPLVNGESMQYGPAISPDGTLLAYVSRETGRDEIYLRRHPQGDQKRQVSVDGGCWPQWDADGDRLWYMADDDLMEVAVVREPRLRLGTPQKLFTRPPGEDMWAIGWALFYQATDDGESFYMLHDAEAGRGSRPLTLVQNWAAAFEED